MSPEAAAEQGFFRRLTEDAALSALLGPGTRIFPGWPGDTLEESDCPRLTFYVSGPAPIAQGIQRVRVSIDEWFWPTGQNGGRAKLLAVDARVAGLFDERLYEYGGHRHYSVAGGFRDAPAGPDAPIRRTREILITSSPA